uniref:Uncharacterized protein n=1 Tax=Rhizophora mucronata TaxID=61149 RepID=A0A2P2QEL8_RHIMU
MVFNFRIMYLFVYMISLLSALHAVL